MRDWAAQNLRPEKSFERQVCRIFCLACNFTLAFDTRQCFTNGAKCQGSPPNCIFNHCEFDSRAACFVLTKFPIRSPSFPHALSANPGESETGPPINTFGADAFGISFHCYVLIPHPVTPNARRRTLTGRLY